MVELFKLPEPLHTGRHMVLWQQAHLTIYTFELKDNVQWSKVLSRHKEKKTTKNITKKPDHLTCFETFEASSLYSVVLLFS